MQRYNFSMREGGMIETTEYDNTFVRWEDAEARIAELEEAITVLAAAHEFYTKNLDSTFAAGRASVLDYHWRDMVDDGIKNNPIARAAVEGGSDE